MRKFISIIKKNIEHIDLTDIEELINQNVRESSLIEYKEADFLNPSNIALQQQFWKLIKRLCGFANNMGGLLILGIKEDENSCAESITPLYQSKTSLINKLRGLILSHTIPSISLKINDVDTNSNNPDEYILVLKILEAPEPVMYINSSDNDSHKYFFRYNEDTIPADHATVRLLFSKKSIEEKLNKYLESKDYGLKIGNEENVVSWIAIPYQFPLETFTEINYTTITTLRDLYQNLSPNDRFHAILGNGRFSHNGILFLFRQQSLYNGFFEIKRDGYVEFKTFIKMDQEFLNENYIIKDLGKFIEYLFHFYSSYDYFGNIRIILSIKKSDISFKLGIKDIGGDYI
ncbi:hypothetical protein LCGC14_2276890, partial [marine sediment metagenome]